MPRYDYECEICHHQFELKQSFDSDPFTNCPQCLEAGSSSNEQAKRRFHSVPIIFKGSGWYVKDKGRKNA